MINGEKCYVPLAADADLILVWAALDGNTQGFVVEKGASGLEIGEREKNMGIKALATYELILKDCRVPKANMLGGGTGCDFNRLLNYSRVACAQGTACPDRLAWGQNPVIVFGCRGRAGVRCIRRNCVLMTGVEAGWVTGEPVCVMRSARS